MSARRADPDEILCQAVEIEAPGKRREFLDAACRGDTALRQQVDALLSNHFRAGEFLEKPAAARLADLPGPQSRDVPHPPVAVDGALGDYRILREIGRGGMGVVYEAEQISLNRRIALKVLAFAVLLDQRHLQRFRIEASAAAQLDHPHIVRIYNVGSERGLHYYAMQFVEGTTLAAVVEQLRREAATKRAGGPEIDPHRLTEPAGQRVEATGTNEGSIRLDATAGVAFSAAETSTLALARLSTMNSSDPAGYFLQVARMGRQVALGLDHAHAHGVLHRDVKPANLLLDDGGDVYITDFGLARIEAQAGMTMTGEMLGTPRYMSPEQVLGKRGVIDHRSDIYSLGATLYELLTLRHAVPGRDRQEVLNRIASDEPRSPRQINPAIPPDLSTIVLKAQAKDPQERYDTAAELADDLRRFINREPIRARPPTWGQRLTKWANRHRSFVAALAATLLFSTLALAAATVFIERAREREEGVGRQLREALGEKDAALAEQRSAQKREAETARRVYPLNIASAQNLLNNRSFGLAHSLLSLYRTDSSAANRRGFEWYYLWGLFEKRGARLLAGHTETVYALSFSPDGELLATASSDRTFRLWETETGRLVRENSEHTSDVNGIVFSPDGTTLATASDDKTIALWDSHTGDRQATLRGHTDMVQHVLFSPDGRILASGSVDGEVRLWDRSTLQELVSVKAHSDRINAMAFSPDGNRLATASGDQTARLWELPSLEPIVTMSHDDPTGVETLVFRPHAGHLVTGDRFGRLIIWNSVSGDLVREENVDVDIRGLAASTDGKRLAIAGMQFPVIVRHGGDLRRAVYSLAKPDVLTPDASWCVALSPDGRYLAAGRHHDAMLWDVSAPPNRQILASFPHGVDFVAVSPDGRSVVTAAGPDGMIRQLDIVDGEEMSRHEGHAGGITCGRYSPDRRVLVTGGRDLQLRVWNTATWRQVRAVPNFWMPVRDFAISVDGQLLATCDGEYCRVWTIGNWESDFEELKSRPDREATEVNFDLHNRLFWGHPHKVVWCEHSGTLLNWNLFPGRRMPVLETTSDGSHLALGFEDGSVGLFDVRKNDGNAAIIIGSHAASVRAVAFSPDDRMLASADAAGTIFLWDVASGTRMLTLDLKELARLDDPCAFPRISLDFSPDGTALIAGAAYRGPDDPDKNRGLIGAWYAPREE